MANRNQDSGFIEEVIGIYYHHKVTKGGRNLSVAALVAVGDGRGKVGLGYGRARAVPMAIEKAAKEARRDMAKVHLVGDTVAHVVEGRHACSRVLLMPASPGTGVKAGSAVRSVLHAVGVRNVLSKVFGNTNPINVAKATMVALRDMMSLEDVMRLRGTDVELFHPQVKRTRPSAAPPAEPPAEPQEPEPQQAVTGEAPA